MKNKLLSMLLILVASGISAKKIPVMDVLYYSVPAEKPILCDSVNVKGEAFMPSSLLDLWMEGQDAASPVNRFTVLKAASDSTFSLRKPASGYLLSLWKYYLMPDNYLPLKLKFQSACAFEVYVDGEKKLTKTTVENRREKAIVKTVELDADPRQYVVLVKMLASATDSCQVSLSLNVETEARDSLSKLTASSSDKRRLYIPDMSTGKRILNTSVSPNGQFALINYSLIYKNGTRSQYAELYRLPEGKQLWTDNSNRNLSWMPKTNALYYTIKGYEGNELRQLDPVTLAETVLVKNLPEGDFTWSPQEHFLIYTIAESAKEDQSDLRRFLSPEDRQPGFRSRSSLYLYDLKTGLRKRLTWGKETTWLNDISPDETAVLFGENRIAITKEPYTTSSLFRLNLQTMKTDTIWQEDKFAINAQFSPDGRQLFMTGGPDAFGGIGLNVKPGQKANQFDVQGFIMDLASKKIRPVTKTFNPSILSADWSKADGKIYLRVEDKDYQRIYAYDPFKDTYQLLPLSPDIVSTFDLSKTARMAVYSGSTVNYTGKAYAIDLKSNKETLLANPGAQRLASVEFGQIKDWNFQAPDSTTIDGRFYLPPNFDPSKKYPMLVYYYGGTSPTARNFESSYPLTMWAAQGYVVYTLQPSGTTG
ncbi:MAG: S9 family peptidase, partial [Bacteroidota bacterium]|nr:S9 family peptidase [Bacteroidota bacterium]